jgi:hypothetical protein
LGPTLVLKVGDEWSHNGFLMDGELVGAGSHNPNTTALNHPIFLFPPHSLPSVVPKTCDANRMFSFPKKIVTPNPNVLCLFPPYYIVGIQKTLRDDAQLCVLPLYNSLLTHSLTHYQVFQKHSNTHFIFGYIVETRILGLV